MKKTLILVLCLVLAGGIFAGYSLTAGSSPAVATEESATPAPAEATPLAVPADYDPDFRFETEDVYGDAWNEAAFAQAKLTMINFWEPWCGPCVNEMAGLQKLYEDYQEQGFQILGVYSDFSYEQEMWQVLAQTRVLYPTLKYVSAFDQFQTGYVPTTIFVDEAGHVLGEPYIGSRSNADWARIVEGLL